MIFKKILIILFYYIIFHLKKQSARGNLKAEMQFIFFIFFKLCG